MTTISGVDISERGSRAEQGIRLLSKVSVAHFARMHLLELTGAKLLKCNTYSGHRSAAFIVNMESNEQVPAIIEPLFQWMGALWM